MKKKIIPLLLASLMAACSEKHVPKESTFNQVARPEILGATLQYLESLTGPPLNISHDGRDRTYKLEQCELTASIAGGQHKLVSALRFLVTSGCDVDIAAFLASSEAKKTPFSQLTFGKLAALTGSPVYFLADCLSGCGNAYDPVVYQHWTGPRISNGLEVMAEVALVTDGVITAANKWRDSMQEREGEDWVMDTQFNCHPEKYADVARSAFSEVRPSAITIGHGLSTPRCVPIAQSPVGDMVVVPPLASECDENYAKTLKKSGLVAKEIEVHGPEDQDFPGYACPYRVRPAPGSRVLKGSKVEYRSAFESG